LGGSILTSWTNRSGISGTAAERSGSGTFTRYMREPKTKLMRKATRMARRKYPSLSVFLVQGMSIAR
jgi:hypothetical protein